MNNSEQILPGGIEGVIKDLQLARRLYPHLGREIVDVSDYTYFSIMFEDSAPQFSELVEKIALDELEQYRILGRLILDLGANPAINIRLRNTPVDLAGDLNTPAQALDEMRRLIPILFDAESAASHEYALLAAESENNPVASEILKSFSENEASHANLLRQVLSAIDS